MHRRPPRTRAFTLLAAVVVALATSTCSSSDADKAGGTRTKPPVVFTLADHEQGPGDVQAWIEEVQRRAGGSLAIQVTNHWRDQEFAYDKATIADVRAGGTFAMRWSLYRDVLTFKRDVSLGGAPTPYLGKPWRRAG